MLFVLESFLDFLKEQEPPFPYGIHEGWLECDGGKISIDKLSEFLTRVNEDGMIRAMRACEETEEKE